MGILLEAKNEAFITFETILNMNLYMDGSSNVKGSSLGIILIVPIEEVVRKSIKYCSITNNEVEYDDVIAGLELAWGLEAEKIELKSDSQLLINQIQGHTWREKLGYSSTRNKSRIFRLNSENER